VCARQNTHFYVDRTYRPGITAVNTRLASDDATANEVLLQLGSGAFDLFRAPASVFVTGQCLYGAVLGSTDGSLTVLLVRDFVGICEGTLSRLCDCSGEILVLGRRLPIPRRLANSRPASVRGHTSPRPA